MESEGRIPMERQTDGMGWDGMERGEVKSNLLGPVK